VLIEEVEVEEVVERGLGAKGEAMGSAALGLTDCTHPILTTDHSVKQQ
jgi:hypothetical protein